MDWTTGLDYWTGLLDWTTGLDYWTHGNCLWRRKEQDYTEIHTAIQESRVIFHRSQHVVLNSVRSWCKCAIKNWSHNPGNEAKYSLVPRLPRSGTRTLKLCRRSLVPSSLVPRLSWNANIYRAESLVSFVRKHDVSKIRQKPKGNVNLRVVQPTTLQRSVCMIFDAR